METKYAKVKQNHVLVLFLLFRAKQDLQNCHQCVCEKEGGMEGEREKEKEKERERERERERENVCVCVCEILVPP